MWDTIQHSLNNLKNKCDAHTANFIDLKVDKINSFVFFPNNSVFQ
jgi:hypothetical protein